MPNRLLREGITTSEKIDALSGEAELFYYRLLVHVDDFGRIDARPAVLIAKTYPLRVDRVKPKHVEEWLAEFEAANLVVIYENDGKRFLEMTNFDPPRAQKSKCAGPKDKGSILIHLRADACEREQAPEDVPYSDSYSDSSTEFDAGGPASPAAPVAPVAVLVVEDWPEGLQWIPPIITRVLAQFDPPYGSLDDWLQPRRWRSLEVQVDAWGRGLGQRFADELEPVFAEFQGYWTERKTKRKDIWRTWMNAVKRWHDRQLGAALRTQQQRPQRRYA